MSLLAMVLGVLKLLGFGTLFNMAEVTNAKAAVFNLFNIGSAF
ncbi:hypothetical protein BSPWISOXPB_5049 [uncultured Gammaproteobacteria bacterium]|nr:hypothetical protein BSPWISOXPB_5049 [uncultured Gammaproteobacteria bacterium]